MSQKLTQKNLLDFLTRKQLSPSVEKESDQIYLTFDISGHSVPVFFGIRSEGHLLQTIAYLPFEVTKATAADLGRLLHLLNRELDMPGFGMDENQALMFYRSVIPFMDQQIDEKAIEMYLRITRIACETFIGAIATITSGTMTIDEVLKKGKVAGV